MSQRDTDAAQEFWILAASILGSSMAFVDGTVVNVALPVMQRDLAASATAVQWVIEAYLLTLSALLLLGGSLADRLGRRRIFGLGVALFAAASVACALAPTIPWLIVSRAVQGVGGALLVPTSLAVLSAGIPDERRGRAIGRWSAFTSATAGLGPVLGGWLVEKGSWRWALWINVPLALGTLAITFSKVAESRDPHPAGIDLRGAACGTLGLAGLVFGLLEGSRLGFTHSPVIVALAVGAISLAVFIPVERRASSPMLPLDMFQSRTFSGANLLTLLLYAALGAELYFLPFNLIQVHRYTPAEAGAALLPLIVLMALLSGRSGKLADRFGPRPSLVVGPLIAAVGYALLALPGVDGSYWTTFFPPVTVLGLGMAVTVAPLTTTVMDSAGRAQAGVASGINNAVSRLASLLAIAVFGILAYHRFGAALVRRLTPLGLPPEVRRQLNREQGRLAAATIPASLPPRLRTAVGATIAGSFVEAFQLVSLVAAGLAVAASVTAWLLIPNGPASDSDRPPSQS